MASNMESVRILHLSDLHGLHRSVEDAFPMVDADILIITGDFTDSGMLDEFEDFNQWLGTLRQRYPYIVVIFGNHEYKAVGDTGEPLERFLDPQRSKDLLPNAIVLEHETVEILGLRIYGSAWCPWHSASRPGDHRASSSRLQRLFSEWKASQPKGYQDHEHRFHEIPEGIDVLLTHGSPFGIMDCCEMGSLQWGGSKALRRAVKRVRPLAHLFGHMHEQRGVWYHEPGKPFRGGIEYRLVNGRGVHQTWGPPEDDYPCQLISCNAMLNHRRIDSSLGGRPSNCIAGPARLIIATRSVSADAERPEPWHFTAPS